MSARRFPDTMMRILKEPGTGNQSRFSSKIQNLITTYRAGEITTCIFQPSVILLSGLYCDSCPLWVLDHCGQCCKSIRFSSNIGFYLQSHLVFWFARYAVCRINQNTSIWLFYQIAFHFTVLNMYYIMQYIDFIMQDAINITHLPDYLRVLWVFPF